MRLLVTGASGFMGKSVVLDALRETDWEVVALTSPTDSGELRWLTRDLHERDLRLEIVRTDLSNVGIDALARRVRGADVVYNLASSTHVPTSISDPYMVVRNNIEVQLTALELARKLKPRLFVQMSTEGVYGETFEPVREWDRPALPSNPYAASKAAQEDLCIAWRRTYGVPVSIVNVVNVFGPGQGAEKFIPTIIRKLRASETIEVHGEKQDGRWVFGARSYEYVGNVASALRWIAGRGHDLENGSPDRWHLEGLKRVSNLELVILIAELLGVEPKIEKVEAGASRPGYDACYTLDGGKIWLAGWEPPFTFEQGMKETVAEVED